LKSSRFSAEHVLQYGKLTNDQRGLITQGAKELMEKSQYKELEKLLADGIINPKSREMLEQLVELAEEE
jgi:hypothetical protein